jgi:hypothetical protein
MFPFARKQNAETKEGTAGTAALDEKQRYGGR